MWQTRMSSHEEANKPLEELASTLYDALRSLALRLLERNPRDRIVDPTELVHECYLSLATKEGFESMKRADFLALASRMLRNILVDHARREKALKRGHGWRKITLSEMARLTSGVNDVDLVRLDEALERLSSVDGRQGRIVELRFFGGLTGEEVATVLGVSRRTVTQEWGMARAWLRRELVGT